MIDAVANGDSDASLRASYSKGSKMKLFEKIGASIAKAAPSDDAEGAPDDSEEETDESPGAALAEALGIPDADPTAVDAALRAAIRKLK